MTRETKIGLLVGLAFIIVIGILLSDHMATTTEPTQAVLDTAASRAREAIVVPGGERAASPVPQVITPRDVTPQAPVPTQNELVQRPVVSEIIVGEATSMRGNDAPQIVNGNNTPVVDPPANSTLTPGIDPRIADAAR